MTSDLKNVRQILHDNSSSVGGFLEFILVKRKGARSVKLKVIPVLLPTVSIEGKPWIPSLVSAFRKVGLVSDGLVKSMDPYFALSHPKALSVGV